MMTLVEIVKEFSQEYENKQSPMVISVCIGPRGDGYNPSSLMSVDEAEQYHSEQIKVFANTDADMVNVITMNYSKEAEGIVRAAKQRVCLLLFHLL
jgi:S-methylmethionine-dependent homocysteine/selenocysteine methylase